MLFEIFQMDYPNMVVPTTLYKLCLPTHILHFSQNAINIDLVVPDRWYFLGDAGFPPLDQLIVPFQGVRYHLAEWG